MFSKWRQEDEKFKVYPGLKNLVNGEEEGRGKNEGINFFPNSWEF